MDMMWGVWWIEENNQWYNTVFPVNWLHWANRIPALACSPAITVFIVMRLHWANRIPALTFSPTLHIGASVLSFYGVCRILWVDVQATCSSSIRKTRMILYYLVCCFHGRLQSPWLRNWIHWGPPVLEVLPPTLSLVTNGDDLSWTHSMIQSWETWVRRWCGTWPFWARAVSLYFSMMIRDELVLRATLC